MRTTDSLPPLRRSCVFVVAACVAGAVACGPSRDPIGRVLSHPRPRAGETAGPSLPTSPLERPPGVRLPREVVPRAYALELSVDPREERFSGRVRIEVELTRAATAIFLHGKGLHVTSATVTPAGGRAERAVWHEVSADEGLYALRTAASIAAGRATLELVYDAPFDRELEGLYRVDHAGRSYAFTQMEPISARRAMPCFDEPGFKTPFEVTLVVRDGDVAIANTREVANEPIAGGRRRFRFARSEPLPTYLLALAVGPLDVREGPTLRSIDGRELRFRGFAAAGRGDELAFALRETPAIFAWLERYTSTPYPYDKLDVVAVPDFGAGAMENAGLITFRDGVLLIAPQTSSVADERSLAYVMAHELSHNYFGNLVTMAWWDDLWLNESFATWLGWRAVAAVRPNDRADESLLSGGQRAMSADSRVAARRIRQPITSHHDIHNAFDGITYGKGAAVLAMFERWLGAEPFQRGIRRYLEAHRHGNATASDFLAAMNHATGRDVGSSYSTFLEQPGVPLVTASLACDEGARPHVRLTQRRYVPIGSSLSPDARWRVPVCLRYADGATSAREQCILLADGAADVELETTSCPRWLTPNAGAAGYYRFAPDATLLARIPLDGSAPFETREMLAIAESLRAGVFAGAIPFEDAMRALQPLARRSERSLVTASMGLFSLARERLVSPGRASHVESAAARTYAPVLRRLGWRARPQEDPDDTLLRGDVIWFLADTARAPDVRRELRGRGFAMLGLDANGVATGSSDPSSLRPDAVEVPLQGIALEVAVQDHGVTAHTAALAGLRSTEDANLRARLIHALTSGTTPELVERGRALVLDPVLRVSEVPDALFGLFAQWEVRASHWAWLQGAWDAVIARVARGDSGGLPWVAASFCEPARRDEVEAFFSPRIQAMPGGPRSLRAAVESIRLCEANVRANRTSADAYFAPASRAQRRP
ncbi:MAG: M1 family metallopeptidase [Deltaproteobacteria bacterium]|nr:M1 family metallopeptidase [Deltaproteobacteria bacterium]